MRIPERLEAKLSQDRLLYGVTLETVDRFARWIGESKIVFFQAYTAHGLQHFQDVLNTASDLISEQALAILTPIDVAIIVHAVMLHDCGMHVSEDGFLTLLQHQQTVGNSHFFSDQPWSKIWVSFLEESRRFSGRLLREIYGDEQPAPPMPDDPRDWTERHRLLVGEFIRRHHPRLAHDVAIFGIPGHAEFLPLLRFNENGTFADMVGVVARSHGLSLRPCLDYIEKFYSIRDYTGAHLAFCMVVLRIADYLQIQSNRAPKQYADVKRIRSPLSANEWKVHQSVVNIHQTHDDPEAVYIQAAPSENNVYLRLQAWLSDLQVELDRSWAVLGEVYGRFREQGLDRLGLRIRRIRSNLDDEKTFARSADYIPGTFKLDVDNVEVMGLLVGPLYDNNVVCGVRELVQNAIDAVREMEELISSGMKISEEDRLQCRGDVEVTVKRMSDGPVLTIQDKGLGMPLDVLTRYFLRAGASYRRSDEWRKFFEDSAGQSKVLRSGRFGIGALAAFLLGDRVTVQTRAFLANDEPGYELTAFLNEDPVEIRRCNIGIGTKITIPLSAAASLALEQMGQDASFRTRGAFYALRKPELYLEVFGKRVTPPFLCAQDGSSDGWTAVSHSDFDRIYWRFFEHRHSDALFCNGILIPGSQGEPDAAFQSKQFRFPSVSIFDPNGRLPVNLNRSAVNWDQASCLEVIAESVISDFVDHVVANEIDPAGYRHPSLTDRAKFAICQGGLTFADEWLFSEAGLRRVLWLSGFELSSAVDTADVLPADCAVLLLSERVSTMTNVIDALRGGYYWFLRDRNNISLDHFSSLGDSFIISDDLRKTHAQGRNVPEYQKKASASAIRLSNDHWLVGSNTPDDLKGYYERLVAHSEGSGANTQHFLALTVARAEKFDGSPSLISKIWLRKFGSAIVPYHKVLAKNGIVLRTGNNKSSVS